MKDLQGTTDPDTFSITSNRLLLIHVDHLELLNSSSSSRKKTPQNLSSPPLPSFPFSILSSQVLRPRPGRCGARRPLRRKAAKEEREGAAAQVVSTLSCASRVICSVPPTQNINEIKFRTFYETKHFPLCLRQIQRSAAYRTFYLPLPKDFPGPGFLTSS